MALLYLMLVKVSGRDVSHISFFLIFQFFCFFRKIELVDELIDFLIGCSEDTRRHVDACIKEALSCAVKSENEQVQLISQTCNQCKNLTIKIDFLRRRLNKFELVFIVGWL